MPTLDKSHVDLEAGTAEIVEKKRTSSVSECSVDLEAEGQDTIKAHLPKVIKRDCRIWQLSFDASNPESEVPIELGCSCKDDWLLTSCVLRLGSKLRETKLVRSVDQLHGMLQVLMMQSLWSSVMKQMMQHL